MSNIEKNQKILDAAMKLRMECPIPQVGEFVEIGGVLSRIGFHHACMGKNHQHRYQIVAEGHGSFYLYSTGTAPESYSGTFGPSVDLTEAVLQPEKQGAWVWIFDAGIAGAGRGKDFYVEERVWKVG